MKKIIDFLRNEDGLETVEYALVGGLIAIAAIVTITAVGANVDRVFGIIDGELSGVGAGS